MKGGHGKEAVMEVNDVITQARDTLSVKRVFDPYEKNGVTVFPAARVQGGAGGEAARVPRVRARARAAVSASTPGRSGRSSSRATR